MKRALTVLMILFLASMSLFAQKKSRKEKCLIVLKDKRTVTPEKITADKNGNLSYVKKVNDRDITQRIKKRDYIYAWVPIKKAKGIRKVAKLLKDKNYDKAMGEARKLYAKYRYLGWDLYCMGIEADALGKLGRVGEAIDLLKPVTSYKLRNKRKEGDYYNALKLLAGFYVDQKNFAEADQILSKIGDAPNPDDAAYALNGRGDIYAKKNQQKDAVVMYLQTALLFPKSNPERPRALFETIKLLKAQSDNRWQKWLEVLKQEYPKSEYLSQLK